MNDTVRDQLGVRIIGDVDGDGQMGVYEYTMARVHLLGRNSLSPENKDLLDINRDSRVSITDYTLIRLDILGLNPGGDNLGGIPDFQPSGGITGLGCSAVINWGGSPGANGYGSV